MNRPKKSRAEFPVLSRKSKLRLRRYQLQFFKCRKPGIVVLHWSRQIGKSFVLAAFAVDRAITNPGHLVTVLSNSRDNGVEFLEKCSEVCGLLRGVLEADGTEVETEDYSTDLSFNNMRLEIRFKMTADEGVKKTSRIKVLAANPRTARGFSGDLILDEFAFHENSAAIWEAAEPILASNPGFLCRIASTGNGKHNMFYRMAAPVPHVIASTLDSSSMSHDEPDGQQTARSVLECGGPPPLSMGTDGEKRRRAAALQDAAALLGKRKRGRPRKSEAARPGKLNTRGLPFSQSGFVLSRVTRSQAYALGVKIYDSATREPITPAEARAQALDKRAYDQNYECAFADENLTLLSHDLISAAECDGVGEISEQDWTANQLAALQLAEGPLFIGFDVARRADLSVITVVEKLGQLFLVRALLRIRDMRLPDQQSRLGQVCRLPKFQRAVIDMTGLGLGLYEYAQNEFGAGRIHGINFAASVPATRVIQQEGRKQPNVRVTEALALELLQCYEDRRIKHPIDTRLRDDLRKPEKITTPGGRVSIAATRDEAGHADHFWSLALAVEAAAVAPAPFAYEGISRGPRRTSFI